MVNEVVAVAHTTVAATKGAEEIEETEEIEDVVAVEVEEGLAVEEGVRVEPPNMIATSNQRSHIVITTPKPRSTFWRLHHSTCHRRRARRETT